jgi:pimeloyl-ACP methyl ester carboxylesterase
LEDAQRTLRLVRFHATEWHFQRDLPSAHVVRLPNANHYVFESNQAEVLTEVNAFISTLP